MGALAEGLLRTLRPHLKPVSQLCAPGSEAWQLGLLVLNCGLCPAAMVTLKCRLGLAVVPSSLIKPPLRCCCEGRW